jgi:tRNA threonylcarbamoyladenosine biosynthesis protein TsaB
MRILGISSATRVISIGLIDDGQLLAETTIADCRSERIVFYIREAGIEPEQLEGIAVTIGPGSYSGLRGGLATAKTMAQSLNVSLVGVPTLDAIAYNLVDIQGTMAVILDAKTDEYNFALFGATQGRIKRLTEDLVLKEASLIEKLDKISGRLWLIGKTDKIKLQLNKNNFSFTDEVHSHPYGVNVARLGLLKIAAGQTDDPLRLVPHYLHQPNIIEYKR